MKYAYVKNGVVKFTVQTNSPGAIFGPKMLTDLHQCPTAVKKGWLYDGVDFTAPPLAEVKAEKKAAIKEAGKERMAAALPYDDLLLAIWDKLPPEAQEVLQPVVDAGTAGIQAVNQAATIEAVDAVDVIWP